MLELDRRDFVDRAFGKVGKMAKRLGGLGTMLGDVSMAGDMTNKVCKSLRGFRDSTWSPRMLAWCVQYRLDDSSRLQTLPELPAVPPELPPQPLRGVGGFNHKVDPLPRQETAESTETSALTNVPATSPRRVRPRANPPVVSGHCAHSEKSVCCVCLRLPLSLSPSFSLSLSPPLPPPLPPPPAL
eukprot:SAG31_NODE_8089_length_1524_cov_2.932632_1_plen_184_part_10